MEHELVSALDHWIAKGEARARAQMLLRPLTARFGEVPEWALRRGQRSNVEQLDRYAERILAARDLEEALEA